MAAYIQIWNPELWNWDTLATDARMTKKGEAVAGSWSCGIRKNYEIGQRVYLYRVGRNHGIVASGYIDGDTFSEEHWGSSGNRALYVPIQFDVILNLGEILPREQLEAEVPFNWRGLQGSGIEIKGEPAGMLKNSWTRHLRSAGRGKAVQTNISAAI